VDIIRDEGFDVVDYVRVAELSEDLVLAAKFEVHVFGVVDEGDFLEVEVFLVFCSLDYHLLVLVVVV
jgi:hypothetical protein